MTQRATTNFRESVPSPSTGFVRDLFKMLPRVPKVAGRRSARIQTKS